MRLLRSARLLLLALFVCAVPAVSHAGIFISVSFGPPVLPVYVQPPCPQPNLIWTPGYWAYGDDGYFWVPGAWVPAPFVGGLWTPGYWGWRSGQYIYNPGYWGYHVGYYGGVNYGGGYLGIGFAGGEWRGGSFAYNTAVVHVNETIIHTTFVDRTVIERSTVVNNNHVAYSGGPGGVQHTATPQEQVAMHETHTAPTSFQQQHETTFKADKTSYAKVNGGHPATLAVAKPLPVESHPAPAHTAAPANMSKTGGAPANNKVMPMTTPRTAAPANAARGGAEAGATASHGTEMRTAPPTHENPQPMHTSAPPRPAPAAHPAPKPAPKAKPEGHEK
jgi:hypothetical protein